MSTIYSFCSVDLYVHLGSGVRTQCHGCITVADILSTPALHVERHVYSISP